MSDYEEKQELRHVSIRQRATNGSTNNGLNEKSTASAKSVRNSFLAGWTAGVTGTLAGHPLDSLKVWVQTGATPRNQSSSPPKAGVLSTLRRFYAGVSGPIVTVGMIQSINFAVYDSTRRYWYYHFDNPDADPSDGSYLNNDSYTSIAVAGATAGAALSLITSPILQIKTKQQTKRDMTFRKALSHTMRHPAIGFGTHFLVETTNRSIYFCTYELCKRYFMNQDDKTTSLTGRMTSAAAAGISCWAVLYPLDALRSRLYASSAAGLDVTAGEMARIMHAENGWRSFYRGFTITTLRAGPVAAAILPVYDLVLDYRNRMDS